MPAHDAYTLARSYVAMRRWDKALVELASVLRTNPDDVDALLLVAYCHRQRGDNDQALVAATSAARLRPDSPYPAIALSAAFVALKRRRDARHAAERAVQLGPQVVGAHLQRIAVDSSGRRATAGGKASAQAALRLAPNDPAVHVAIGGLSLRQGRAAAARRSYREALRLDPDNRDARYALAVVGNGYGRRSAQLLRGLIRTDPDDPRYESMLRAGLTGAVVLAGLVTAMAALLVAPRPNRPPPSLLLVAASIVVSLGVQACAVVYLRAVGGRNVLVFLRGHGWRRRMMLVAIALILLADFLLVIALFVPADASGVLLNLAPLLVLGAIFAFVIGSAGRRTR